MAAMEAPPPDEEAVEALVEEAKNLADEVNTLEIYHAYYPGA